MARLKYPYITLTVADVSKIMKSFASALPSQVLETLAAMTLILLLIMKATVRHAIKNAWWE